MTTAFYRTGTVAVTQNSKVVTGTGTNWTTGPTKPLAGDVFIFNNKMYEIDSVVSDIEIRLYRNFEDSTASSKSYAIMRNASLNISARIAAQVAQVVNQKQIMVDEFHDFLTNNTDSTVPLTDTLGNKIDVTPIPMLDEIYNQATKGLNDKADEVINSQRARSEADMNQMRKQNDEIFDASGMVQMGIGHTVNNVNSGIWVDQSSAATNLFYMGKSGVASGHLGESETDYAVTNIAGFLSSIKNINYSNDLSRCRLPPAPKGYDVADSTGNCRGSGKAVLNLRTEADPKYGDIADSDEEAVERAFEGGCKNGSFRQGTEYWRDYGGSSLSVSNGVATVTCNSTGGGGVYQTVLAEAGKPHTIELTGVDSTISNTEIIAYDGNSFGTRLDSVFAKDLGSATFEVTPTSGAIRIYIYTASVIGNQVTLHSVSVKPVTEEVVTNPVDLTGLEGFLREVSMTNPFVYPGGIIQSKATRMNGIVTSRSNRPDTYYAVYDGDTTSAGLGVNFFAANTFDQGKMLADESNNLFKLADGRLVQFCIRNRAIRGAGNGDWVSIDPAKDSFSLRKQGDEVVPQGDLDAAVRQSGNQYFYSSANPPVSIADESFHGHRGVYQVRPISGGLCAVNGECYFLVLATIPRLNQGAFCKGLNEFGTAGFEATNTSCAFWYSSIAPEIHSAKDCFTKKSTTYAPSGSLTRPDLARRPDGKFYDAIYASGLNGVIDHRLPAKHMEDDWLDPKQKLESAKFRGAQKLVWTKMFGDEHFNHSSNKISVFSEEIVVYVDFASTKLIGEYISAHNSDTGEVISGRIVRAANGTYLTILIATASGQMTTLKATGGDAYVALTTRTNTTVSGEYSVDTVFGVPSDLLLIDVLKNGFLGYWGESKASIDSELPRKVSESLMKRVFTGDSGQSWTGQGDLQVGAANTIGVSYSNSETVIFTTTAYAYQTEEAGNSPIVGGEKGVSRDVWSCMSATPSAGALFSESLLRKATKSLSSGTRAANLSVESYFLNTDGRLYTQGSAYPFRHAELNLAAPDNDSPAVKAQYSLVEENGQLFIQVQANELGYLSMASGGSKASDASTSFVAGSMYRITSAHVNPVYFACSKPVTTAFKDLRITKDGYVIGNSSGTVYGYMIDAQESGSWGDDDAIKITANGSDTFVDRNGITRKSVCHRSKFPIGWARTAAKVGSENSPA